MNGVGKLWCGERHVNNGTHLCCAIVSKDVGIQGSKLYAPVKRFAESSFLWIILLILTKYFRLLYPLSRNTL